MFGCVDVCIVAVSILLIVFVKNLTNNPPLIFNIYQRRNGFFWLKAAFMYTILSLRKLKKPTAATLCKTYEKIENPQPLSKHENAIDAVYLNGANSSGDHLILGTAQRPKNLLDGFLFLKLKKTNLGILESIRVPNTALKQTDEEFGSFAAEGFKFTMLEPMKRWKLKFTGKLKESADPAKVHDVIIDADWTSNLPVFHFDTDLHPWAMAEAMAYEKFSRDYFKTLQMNHQTHYEQFGTLKGLVTVDGVEYSLNVDSVRDHSFGDHREWRIFHRYVLHFVALENGDRIHLGRICIPIMFSRFTTGYYYCAKTKKMHAISSTDLELFHYGEESVPKDYAFSFKSNGETYTMQVLIKEKPHFYISKDWESKVVEGLCKVRVNGVNGWGCAEWLFRNVQEHNVEDFDAELLK